MNTHASDNTSIRPAAVAGSFYPGNPAELSVMIGQMLDSASTSGAVPKIMIAPHAGYIYSGPVAASVYRLLQPAHDKIKRVVLLGPSHHVPFQGIATSSAGYFTTPLGNIKIDTQANQQLLDIPGVIESDLAHQYEHSLEVHIPFLQTVLDDFKLVPLVVGEVNRKDVAAIIENLWGGDETLFVISSDLSHYHDYLEAQQLDQATSDAIMHKRPDNINYEDACGRNPVCGALEIAKRYNMEIINLDLRNSGDTAGPRDRVVGYGAYAFYE